MLRWIGRFTCFSAAHAGAIARPDYGPCTTIYNRFNRWAKRGRWKAIFEALARCGKDGVTLSIDSTSIKAHLTQLDCCQSLAPARRFGKLSKARLRLGSQIMRCFFFLTAVALAVMCNSVSAQSTQPYAGFEQRPIKALSSQQIDDLRTGRGMGLALAAELNGYPGPRHVLELAHPLNLSSDQRAQVQHLFDAMEREAAPLGTKLIEQESELDQLFSARVVTPETLKAAIDAISLTQARLRESHLKYHLRTAAVLDQNQMQQYAELRGYRKPEHHHHQ